MASIPFKRATTNQSIRPRLTYTSLTMAHLGEVAVARDVLRVSGAQRVELLVGAGQALDERVGEDFVEPKLAVA